MEQDEGNGGDHDMRASTMQATVKMAAAAMVLTMGLAGAVQAQPRRGGPGFGPGRGAGFGQGFEVRVGNSVRSADSWR